MSARWLSIREPAAVGRGGRAGLDPETLRVAAGIVEDVRRRGEAAVREHGERLGDLLPGQPLLLGPGELLRAYSALPQPEQELLARTAGRIRDFARAQRAALSELDVAIPGGRAGHHIVPLERAGCYAPGGRFPLPSSVLMTAVVARAAGVSEVVVASPRPAPVTLAAAHVAGADAVLAVGGAQGVAALALGVGGIGACDIVVGPGNRYVTAAKACLHGQAGIDMLAGPSELVVVADETARAAVVAADLLAQAEHDPDALPVLVTHHHALLEQVEAELTKQLATLPTAAGARAALGNGYAVLTADLAESLAVADRIAPEHLELLVADDRAEWAAGRVRHAGGVFIGAGAAEVLGDYGAGPNHVLPTGGAARFVAGLSVLSFVRVRTYIRVADSGTAGAAGLYADAVQLARLEGLEGHARSAEQRLGVTDP